MIKNNYNKFMLFLIFLLVLPLMLVACDKTPAKYKMKNFYGTYDRFANDYYNVIFSFNGNRNNNDLTTGWWNICELKENSFVYIDTTGETKEQECDAALIAEIQELQQRIGHKVTVEKKNIMFVESNTIMKIKNTITKFDGHEYFSAAIGDDGVNMLIGRYENIGTEKEQKVISVVAKEKIELQENEWEVAVTKKFVK